MTETCFNHLPLCDRPVPAAEVIKDMHMEDRGNDSVPATKCHKSKGEA